MAWVQADVDALKAAIATGALSVRYADGKSVTYRSLDEMWATLARLEDEVATTKRPRFHYPAIGSGSL